MGKTEIMPLYFDTAATTRVAPEVLAAMVEALESSTAFANPSSAEHLPGREVANAIAAARSSIARELGVSAEEILFTSGATESINLALQGITRGYASHGRHIADRTRRHARLLRRAGAPGCPNGPRATTPSWSWPSRCSTP
ncbi:aminotransferase class V-fold PLP-dependent enzyme [Thiocystis violacea]|uniref:aminotransferase class V-fold PLP-dependent enzyme n=1 Tax=Thiocystis violacea TaxID=13725 RepID=UPI001907671F